MTATSTPMAAIMLATWGFRRADAEQYATVRLPHDAVIHEPRDPAAPGGADLGWFPGGSYVHRTVWRRGPGMARRPHAALRFQGAQGEATLSVNGEPTGRVRSGCTETELTPR